MEDRLASSAAPRPTEVPANRLKVLLPLPLAGALDYRAPTGAAPPAPGSFVRVPLGTRDRIGVVWDGAADGDGPSPARLKPVLETLPTPPLRPELRRFVERVALYTMAPPGAVLRMAMSVAEALLPPPPRRACAPTTAGLAALAGAAKLTPARRRVLERLR